MRRIMRRMLLIRVGELLESDDCCAGCCTDAWSRNNIEVVDQKAY